MTEAIPAAQALRVLISSRDRPVELHATLSTLWAHCLDQEVLDVRVLVHASDDAQARRYERVAAEHPYATFAAEQEFKPSLLALARGARFLAFVSDDTVVLRPWSAASALRMLLSVPKAVGVALHLGANLTASADEGGAPLTVPPSLELIEGWRACDWPECQGDFGRPVELAASIFRYDDLWPVLDALPYASLAELQVALRGRAPNLAARKPALLYPGTSVAVRVASPDRDGAQGDQRALLGAFDAGARLEVGALAGHVPAAAREALPLPLRGAAGPAAPARAASPPAPAVPPLFEGHQAWWEGGMKLPAPAEVKARALLEVARRHGLEVLVETGTYLGDTTAALAPHFSEVHTIELDEALHARAQRRFAGEPKVHCLHGDSARQLPRVLAGLDSPSLFWLDAHFSGGITARAEEDTPVVAELEAILDHPVRGHVVMVDDARLFGVDPAYPTVREIIELVRRRRPDCAVDVALDSIRITPGTPAPPAA